MYVQIYHDILLGHRKERDIQFVHTPMTHDLNIFISVFWLIY